MLEITSRTWLINMLLGSLYPRLLDQRHIHYQLVWYSHSTLLFPRLIHSYAITIGGPIVHPSVQSLVMTPICPRSLSFRTVLLPPSANIRLEV